MSEMKTITINGVTYTIVDPEAAHIDDTTVGAGAWSSKNIVDKLCGTFVASGAFITCEPIEGVPLEVYTHINGATVGGTLTLHHTGKNMLSYPYSHTTRHTQGIDFTDNGDGSITLNGTTTSAWTTFSFHDEADIDKVKLIDGETYFASLGGDVPSDIAFIFLYSNADGEDIYHNTEKPLKWSSKYTLKNLYLQIAEAGKTFNDVIVYPQIEIGTVETDFAPYYGEKKTVVIPALDFGGIYQWGSGLLTWNDGTYDHVNQLTPQTIAAFPDVNYLWSSIGNTSVGGRYSIVKDVAKLRQDVDALSADAEALTAEVEELAADAEAFKTVFGTSTNPVILRKLPNGTYNVRGYVKLYASAGTLTNWKNLCHIINYGSYSSVMMFNAGGNTIVRYNITDYSSSYVKTELSNLATKSYVEQAIENAIMEGLTT